MKLFSIKYLILYIVVWLFLFGTTNASDSEILYSENDWWYYFVLLDSQIKLWTVWEEGDLENFMKTIEESKDLLSNDPVFLLDKTMTFEENFIIYLDRVSESLNNLSINLSFMDYSMGNFDHNKTLCLSDREYYQTQFFDSLKRGSSNVDHYLDLVVLNEQCASYNRIYYNAYEDIYEEMEFYYDTLNRKYDYWVSNREDIVRNRDFYYNEN